ncbi:uncharacterized protein A4U43_C02F3610 [Asparagus officinalis]|uniref:Transcription repressor n=1 Tax=Asparagus officinalis TaxID=4686 RepID=A0A5P1FKN0_ASPOF|nr:transcription repressor OFP2-like [Asparagus officinalis]ONK77150.1 uncharacterized protein A4U43_C02F3610 [Asparagus officinalis]
MGNHRFRLQEMMPNAWFYKLREMNKPMINRKPCTSPSTQTPTKKTHPQPSPTQLIPSRASYYFPSNSPLHPRALDTHFPLDSPRKSIQKPRKKPISPIPVPSPTDIVFELPPIITTPLPKPREEEEEEEVKEKKKKKKEKKSSSLRTRVNSPRVSMAKRVRIAEQKSRQRKGSVSESFAVMKNSSDPKRDFRESMMEMIVENNLKASRDLEELLACYLSLNSNEYHDVIVKAFEEIWFDVISVSF